MDRSTGHTTDKPEALVPSWAVWALTAAGLAVAAVPLFYFQHFHNGFAQQAAEWGQFGDYLGGVLNPIFGFFSLMALLLALGMQSKALQMSRTELELSRKELELTREELGKATTAQEEQHREMQRQSFRDTYFRLLDRSRQILDDFGTGGLSGRAVLMKLYDRHLRSVPVHGANSLEIARSAFDHFYGKESGQLGPYLRTLYHLFTFVEDTKALSIEDKLRYAEIARSQLSDVEVCVLFYDGLSDEGKNFKPLIERYGLLRNVRADYLRTPEEYLDRSLYSPRAFLSFADRLHAELTEMGIDQ